MGDKNPYDDSNNPAPTQYGQPVGMQPTVTQPGQPHPGGMQMMAVPQMVTSNCPPGLEYLTQIDQLLIYQKKQLSELLCGCEWENEYRITNSMGQQVYYAKEDTGFCNRQCCGAMRPFTMHVTDNANREVLTIKRPYRCEGCCCFCCLMELEVLTPDGVSLGRIQQTWSLIYPKFDVRNPEDDTLLKIRGPCLQCRCCGDVNFDIKSPDLEATIGRISKQWAGLGAEFLTDADNFGITFPMDLDVKMKAVMIGAAFLIDFMFYESQQKK